MIGTHGKWRNLLKVFKIGGKTQFSIRLNKNHFSFNLISVSTEESFCNTKELTFFATP